MNIKEASEIVGIDKQIEGVLGNDAATHKCTPEQLVGTVELDK